ncbi:MAG: exodeoxyribonuclease VII large subunit [Oscillospiraceae bacterium]|jgi:exodeoxyribonuclease VII large subunit|nr:exodeoxyribonuclease VII large subunit [Oscillospiraceae bacterium]
MQPQIFEVSQINEYLKLRFEEDDFLQSLLIRGEISNYKLYPSGHHYFTLKDAGGQMRCVMFKGSAYRLRFRPENGMKVIAGGRVAVFPRDGAYQLYCTELTPDGVGDLHVAFEQLKQKLSAEGLFAQEHKTPLPRYPRCIGIITSSAGAALHDMLRILKKRYPLTRVRLLAVRVQGEQAPAEIASAIAYANRYQVADLLITGRGGGSIEDLWAFNDERVARAIFASTIPIISAVGHEPDVTISDFVADLRAATPSNAAELAVPDQGELRQKLAMTNSMLLSLMSKRLKAERQRVSALSQARVLRSPMNYYNDKRLQLDYTHRSLLAASQRLLYGKRERFVRLTASLDAMSPLKVLGRGYSMTSKANGKLLRAVGEVTLGDTIVTALPDGKILSAVTQIQEDTNGEF